MVRIDIPSSKGFLYLNWAFWIHGILDIIVAILLTVWPRVAIVTMGITDDPLSYVWVYVAAGGLWVVGVTSFYTALEDNLHALIILLDGKIFWSAAIVIGHIVTIVSLGNAGRSTPAVMWVTFSIFVLGFILWGAYRIAYQCCYQRRVVSVRDI